MLRSIPIIIIQPSFYLGWRSEVKGSCWVRFLKGWVTQKWGASALSQNFTNKHSWKLGSHGKFKYGLRTSFKAILRSFEGHLSTLLNLKSVTPIIYISMCILLIWYGPFWQLLRPLQPPNSFGVKSDLGFEISDPNYLLIHVHIVYMVWAFLAASEATTASKQPQR